MVIGKRSIYIDVLIWLEGAVYILSRATRRALSGLEAFEFNQYGIISAEDKVYYHAV